MSASGNDEVARYAATIMGFIDEAISEGAVPATVRSFTELQSYLDANEFLEHAGVPYDGSDTTLALTVDVEQEVTRRLAAPTRPYCTFGRCVYPLHDHSTLTGPGGIELSRPDPLRCADCGHTAHYDSKLRVVRHDDPLLQARGCPSMTGRHEEPYGEEAAPHGGGRDTAPDWVDGWVAAADDPGCYTFGPYPAQTRPSHRRADGSVPARFDLDAVGLIAEDQRYAPAASAIGAPIEVVDGQPHHCGTPDRVLPAGPDGWWYLDTPPWRWVPCDLGPGNPVWQTLFDTVPTPGGTRRRCTVCGAVDDIDTTVVWSRIGAGHQDTIDRCRRCGSTRVPYAELPARNERAPWPAPGPAPTGADGTVWDGREGLPGGWWRMPHDITLRIRAHGTGLDGLVVSTQMHCSFAPAGSAYVDLRALTAWDTNRDLHSPTRAAYQALTDQFPGRFTTVVDIAHPGTVFLAVALLALTDEITDAILTHHRGIRTREGTAPGRTHEAGFADSAEDRRPGEQPEHDCQAAGTLAYEAHYGAPGIGQAWHCTMCGRAWSRIGGIFSPAESGAHILSPQDVE
jgi:hypothetical protein